MLVTHAELVNPVLSGDLAMLLLSDVPAVLTIVWAADFKLIQESTYREYNGICQA